MGKAWTRQGNKHWLSNLQPIVKALNALEKQRLGGKVPADVLEDPTSQYNFEMQPANTMKYNEGDRVRIQIERDIYAKGYTPRWSQIVFEVVKVLPHRRVPAYKLADGDEAIGGIFYENELVQACLSCEIVQKNEIACIQGYTLWKTTILGLRGL